MKISNKKHITLTVEDTKDLLIKQLYDSQGISGIFDVKFKLTQRQIPSQYPQDCHYVTEFDGVEITVNLNEER
jgi:hypothetical protein